MEHIKKFFTNILEPGIPPQNLKLRIVQERNYEKSLLFKLQDSNENTKDLKEELLLCRRRIDGYESVYPSLRKI